jgi:hypothetical protein
MCARLARSGCGRLGTPDRRRPRRSACRSPYRRTGSRCRPCRAACRCPPGRTAGRYRSRRSACRCRHHRRGLAFGSAPLTWSSVIVSLPPWPKAWISETLATVGVSPLTRTAPLTSSCPAALRLIVSELSRLSPKTVSTPEPGLKLAVTAALAARSSRRAHRPRAPSRRAAYGPHGAGRGSFPCACRSLRGDCVGEEGCAMGRRSGRPEEERASACRSGGRDGMASGCTVSGTGKLGIGVRHEVKASRRLCGGNTSARVWATRHGPRPPGAGRRPRGAAGASR